ncbi:MAG: PaaI family thioesterase [Actinobacteria bacterium]|nr:PaaI family thioesterase [Actinomycetota bacterium]
MENRVGEETREYIAKDRYASSLGAELTDIRPGWAMVSMKLREEHLNFMGMIHGGVMFSLADVAFGAAANSFGSRAMALSVGIDFLAAPKTVGDMTAEVELVQRAGKMGFYRMKVTDAEGVIVAQCHGWAYHTGKPLLSKG